MPTKQTSSDPSARAAAIVIISVAEYVMPVRSDPPLFCDLALPVNNLR